MTSLRERARPVFSGNSGMTLGTILSDGPEPAIGSETVQRDRLAQLLEL